MRIVNDQYEFDFMMDCLKPFDEWEEGDIIELSGSVYNDGFFVITNGTLVRQGD